jgi:hypothetical protein
MTLAELKEKHPELFKEVQEAATAELRTELTDKDRKIAILEEQNTQLTEANKVNSDRVAKLEKSEAIRTERELKARADEIFSESIGSSDIPDRLRPKVRAQVDHNKFIKEGTFDEAAFSEACKKEIGSWENDLGDAYKGKTTVQGFSNPGKGDSNSDQVKTDLVDRMLGYVVEPQTVQ